MTIIEILDAYDRPCAFSHFTDIQQPPFLIYAIPSTNNFNADNINYFAIKEYTIELYSRVNVLKEEERLETYLTKHGIGWEKVSQEWVDEEKVMMSVYNVG